MYNYPYGDNQQINLNWIISEIIALHQRLDPDYTAPTFTQIYPFSETQQLNLDWILTELKALKELAPTPPPTEEIDEIGQALIAGAYDADTSYQKNDYIVQDGKVYRANAATTGTFDPTKWNEVMLGNDLAIITRWADATNTYLNNLAASNVANDSSVTGTTVKDVLNNLNGAITNGTLLNGMPQTAMRIPANSDLNSYTTAGTYFIYSDADAGTIANTPRNASATIYVINRANANYKAQIYIPTSSIYVYFVRNYNAGSWTNWETILNTNNNIANVEYGNSATKHYSAGEWLVLDNGSLYKAINEIQNGDQFTTGTNITSSPVTVSDLVAQLANGIEFGEWTPHVYDLNTYKRATPHTGVYFHVGKLWVLAYETYDGGTACDLSGITTMLQIRNFPVNGINIIGGVFDIDQVATVNNHYIQAAIENRIYFRPNVLSTAFTDATNVKMSFIVFGIKP